MQEMKAQLETLRKPTAKVMEEVFKKYHDLCMAADPPLTQIDVSEPGINWKALLMSLPPPQHSSILGCGMRKVILKETDCVYEGIYRFHVQRLDGSLGVFEWREAYDDPYHSYKDKSFRHDVDTALRAAVLPQLIEYKRCWLRITKWSSTAASLAARCRGSALWCSISPPPLRLSSTRF